LHCSHKFHIQWGRLIPIEKDKGGGHRTQQKKKKALMRFFEADCSNERAIRRGGPRIIVGRNPEVFLLSSTNCRSFGREKKKGPREKPG